MLETESYITTLTIYQLSYPSLVLYVSYFKCSTLSVLFDNQQESKLIVDKPLGLVNKPDSNS